MKGFDPKARLKHFKRDKIILHADRYSWFAAAAADEAFTQSGLEMPFKDPYRAACIIGSGVGGLTTFEIAYHELFTQNKRATHPLTLLRSSAVRLRPTSASNTASRVRRSHVQRLLDRDARHRHRRDYIREGLVDVGIAGASESVINYGTMKAWQAMRVLSPEGCFPFAKKRNGTVLGEGAGILVLEELEHAKARGAKILAELMGFGMTSDAKDMVNPDIEGPSEAMRLALEDAGLAPSDIDYLNAHGTATTVNDVNETSAIKRGVRQRTPASWRSPRPSRCTAIFSAPAAASRRWPASRPSRRGSCRRPSASTSPIPVRSRLRAERRRARRRSTTSCRTRSPSAASTRCSVFGPAPA